jgi:hypothetical protein
VLIALLVVVGVDLAVVLALALLVILHNRWLKRQPGEFAGAIRASSGEVSGLRSKWTRGSGRWVRDVLLWNGAPLKLRNTVIGVDEIASERSADVGEVKRLGKHPVVAQLVAGSAVIEVAADADDHGRLIGEGELL